MDTKPKDIRADHPLQQPAARRPYVKPALINLGRVADLTQGRSGLGSDGGSGRIGKH